MPQQKNYEITWKDDRIHIYRQNKEHKEQILESNVHRKSAFSQDYIKITTNASCPWHLMFLYKWQSIFSPLQI